MSHELTNAEVLAITQRMVTILRDPDPDPMLFGLLYEVPLTAANLTLLLAAVATAAATASLQAAGVDLDDAGERAAFTVRTRTTMPAADTAGFELAAGELTNLACAFVLADDDAAESAAVQAAAERVVTRGREFTLLTLGAMLTHLRRLLNGDTRGVIRK